MSHGGSAAQGQFESEAKGFGEDPVGAVEIARMEIHSLETVTVTDQQFLTGAQDGLPARIGGELRLPPGTLKVPAVILVNGSAGIGANVALWARELNGLGVAAFLVDCFTGRGICETITDQSKLGSLNMIIDAYRALELLSKHERIDVSRIAVMGFSKGGFVALYASLHRFRRMHGARGVDFAAYLPFYAPCYTTYLEDEQVSDRPIRLFHGTADDYVSIAPTRGYVERLRHAGKDVQLTEYVGARHAFDNPLYRAPFSFSDAVTTTLCRRAERAGGVVVNLETGRPFSWSDACVRRGATVGYEPVAAAGARKAVRAFLATTFKLPQ
ncbi:MAG TPA: dienelactone hydrolase family protein [Candidatus Dormibacteraeota bacterium]|nr:dienelactone hydrolase family protein [Candidatus Dormibacteraeota bacterium]